MQYTFADLQSKLSESNKHNILFGHGKYRDRVDILYEMLHYLVTEGAAPKSWIFQAAHVSRSMYTMGFVDYMIDMGFVEFVKNCSDKYHRKPKNPGTLKKTLIQVTPKGKELYNRLKLARELIYAEPTN